MKQITILTTAEVSPETLYEWVIEQPYGSCYNLHGFGIIERDAAGVYLAPSTNLLLFDGEDEEDIEKARLVLGARRALVISLNISASRGSEELALEIAQQIKNKYVFYNK